MEVGFMMRKFWLRMRRRCRRIIQPCVVTFVTIAAVLYMIGNIVSVREVSQTVGEEADENVEVSDARVLAIRADHPKFDLDPSRLPDARLKTILLWNRLFWLPPSKYFGTGQQPFIEAGCLVSDCFISDDRSLMPPSEYDSIVFFWPQMRTIPFTYSRKPSQTYVYLNDEPPSEYMKEDLSGFNNFFNFTVSYRRDSDIVWPYGIVEKIHPPPRPVKPTNYAKGKKKLVAWFVSNCKTRNHREEYVTHLKKYVDVDIYGRCGDLECVPNYEHTGPEPCHDMLAKDYKFYLSFENTFCRDYVTEKLFKILDRDIVPIVYGAVNYSAIAPPNSYIDATQLSAKKLAQLLLKLDEDDDQYNQYLHNKFGYRVQRERRFFANRAFCQLCEYLHKPNKVDQTYDRFDQWWSVENHCHSSGLFIIPFKEFSFDQVDIVPFSPAVIPPSPF